MNAPKERPSWLHEDLAAARELARLSGPKLAESWTARAAQKQVLSNILHGREASREARKHIAEKMTGRPLDDLRFVVAEVLGESV